ncbi:hypothetical protein ETI06_08365 [Macrococcoides goetzii]|nr:hypothetical protein [Macrococcus goetzii]TDM42354.1 hypothetical protein ETI10_04440 [Macrococcus goetzii]TDM47664.1 hypothetical protein ETI08_00600 [Macrococcus goetzii]TDM49034.1 hypothetical protein ETI06_08365 [Macrococcus goetzii]
MKIFGEKIENLKFKNIPSVYAVILNAAKEKVLTVRNGKDRNYVDEIHIETLNEKEKVLDNIL